ATQRRLVAEMALGAVQRPRRWPALRLALPLAAAVAATAVLVFLAARPREVAFWVGADPAPGRPGAFLRAETGRALAVQFDSGTTLDLAPGSMARVAATSREQLRVTLLQGAATSTVRDLGRGRWTVEAGPYNVTALGTQFTVRWDAGQLALDVAVARGVVVVEGGVLDRQGVRLHAGQALRVGRDGEVVIRSAGGAPAALAAGPGPVGTSGAPAPASQALEATAAPAPARGPRGAPPAPPRARGGPTAAAPEPPAEAAEAAPTAEAPAAVEAKPAPEPPTPSWKEAQGRGDYADAVAEAQRAGLPVLVRTLSEEDLRLLADAARYARNGPVSRQVLLALRARFPGTMHARTASFLLGRVAEELAADPAGAARWYETYLREAPAGVMAEEALGRRIETCRKAGLGPAARAAAERYLQRHPGGVYTPIARAALQ
ncbi:MAG TPA: FecR family protein, partial [Polyangia bacterium]